MYPDAPPPPLRRPSAANNSAEEPPAETAAWRMRRQQEPERIIILGAGPVGLEAALYAQRLGFKTLIFERESLPAPEVRTWAHVPMFTPWGENRTPLGEQALTGQAGRGASTPAPAASVHPTGGEFIASYLDPLARLLGDSLHLETRVVGVGRSYLFPEDFADAPERREVKRFRVLTRSPQEERLFSADYVFDTSGISHSPRWAGAGGLPALGEMGSTHHLFHTIPDVTGKDRIRFLGKKTLLIGDGSSSATSALLFAEVLDLDPNGSLVWATRTPSELPLPLVPGDPLPRRDLLLKKANLLVAGKHPRIEHLPLTQVEAIQHSLASGRFQVTLQVGRVTRRVAFDSVIANVGARPDAQTFERSLQADEPGFYTLGSKACPGGFLLRDGRRQIRDAFRRISGDSCLDLYAEAEAERVKDGEASLEAEASTVA